MTYQQQAQSAAIAAGIDANIFVKQIQAESGFNPNAKSRAGAIGIAQFMPATAQGLGLNPYDPSASLRAAAAYDARSLRAYHGDYQKMLAAYNAGGGAVNNAVANYGSDWLAHMPTETRNYVAEIMSGGNAPTVSSNTNNSQQQNNQQPQALDPNTPVIGVLAPLVNTFQTLTSPDTWVRVGLFAVAVVLLIIGMMVIATGEEAKQQ